MEYPKAFHFHLTVSSTRVYQYEKIEIKFVFSHLYIKSVANAERAKRMAIIIVALKRIFSEPLLV